MFFFLPLSSTCNCLSRRPLVASSCGAAHTNRLIFRLLCHTTPCVCSVCSVVLCCTRWVVCWSGERTVCETWPWQSAGTLSASHTWHMLHCDSKQLRETYDTLYSSLIFIRRLKKKVDVLQKVVVDVSCQFSGKMPEVISVITWPALITTEHHFDWDYVNIL